MIHKQNDLKYKKNLINISVKIVQYVINNHKIPIVIQHRTFST
jgi:hypothetical protein